MADRGYGGRLAALAVAGLVVLSATAFAGGARSPVRTSSLVDAAPAAATVVPTSAAAATMPDDDVTSPARAPRGRSVRIDPGWLARTARSAGIPAPALRAYARAQLGAPTGCDLGWTTLAGIGWVESQHGTLGDRRLRADGRPSSPIVGPALDGAGDVAAIPADAAGQSLHGDPLWDHAVGPMQFLPATWATWETDGDRDGSADPQDVDDAAAAAAAYLCASGRSLTGPQWSVAVLSYNHDPSYVGIVFAAAQAYADRTS